MRHRVPRLHRAVAADRAGHPRALGSKEEIVLTQLLDFWTGTWSASIDRGS